MKKTRKPTNRKRLPKQHPDTKQRKYAQKKKIESSARTQWLQILSEAMDEDQAPDAGRSPAPARNGRRATPEMNLYVVEGNLRSVRRFR
jgi:truncated hemoglobin YjbI